MNSLAQVGELMDLETAVGISSSGVVSESIRREVRELADRLVKGLLRAMCDAQCPAVERIEGFLNTYFAELMAVALMAAIRFQPAHSLIVLVI